MQTYIYLSDDKIGELAQQLPPPSRWRRFLGRISGAQVTVMGSGGGINVAPREPEQIIPVMQRVWKHLKSEDQVGTFDDPKRYFHGQLEFYYGIFDIVNPPVLFLVGGTERTIVALGGQKKHVRGYRDQKFEAVQNAVSAAMEPEVAMAIFQSFDPSSAQDATGTSIPVLDDDLWAMDVSYMYENSQIWQGRKMEFEVLARKEKLTQISASVDSPNWVLIGSPIFVAQV